MYFNISKKNFLGCIVLLALVFTACDKKNKTENAHLSVNPFDTTQLESQTLSAEDRTKLASASGKSVALINQDALAKRILESTDKLHVYCFWETQNESSVATMKAIQEVSNSYDSTQLKVVFIHLSSGQNPAAVNLFIRENQISDETVLLENADLSFFNQKIKKELPKMTELPVVFMVNKAEETFQWYNKSLETKEFLALLQPLL